MRVGSIQLHRARVSHPAELIEQPDLRELGATGQSVYGNLVVQEYNSKLRGVLGLRIYDEMRRSDGQVRAVLRVVKAPIISAQWYIEPFSDDELDVEVSEFVWWALNNMHHTFIRFLWEALLMLDFGHYVFEKVYEVATWTPKPTEEHSRPRERTVIKWKKMAPRHPMTIAEWKFDRDGMLKGIVQNTAGFGDRDSQVFIDVDKLLVFTLDEEAEDPTGISILRSAYKHWYYKDNLYRVDAIQKERHGIGVPVVKLPPGFTPKDKDLANEMGENLRTNEKAHVTLPPLWDLTFAEMRTNPADALKSAEHHDLMIARNALTQFINLGSTTSGSRALGGEQIDIFTKTLRYLTDIVRGQVNHYVIPQLVDWNYRVHGYPQLKVRRIGETGEQRAFSAALRNLVGVGAITATPELEEFASDQLDMPRPSKEAMARTWQERGKSQGQGQRSETTKPTGEDRGGGR
jgi:hypothetical protein